MLAPAAAPEWGAPWMLPQVDTVPRIVTAARVTPSASSGARRPSGVGALGVALTIGALLGACGSSSPQLPGPARSGVLSASGGYGGVRLGAPISSLASRLGPPLATNNTEFLAPAVQPPFLPADNPYDIVYPDARFTTVAGRVASISVYGRGARSDTGVSIGEPLRAVRAALPGARCLAGRGGLDPEQPGCQVMPARGVYEYFSGDPVAVMALSGQSILP